MPSARHQRPVYWSVGWWWAFSVLTSRNSVSYSSSRRHHFAQMGSLVHKLPDTPVKSYLRNTYIYGLLDVCCMITSEREARSEFFCGLTLLLVGGGGGGRIGPPASFSALYGKRLKMGTWNFLTFPIHSLGMLYQIFEFLLRAEALPGPLSRACLPSFGQFFLQIFWNCKNLIVCDGLVYWETCPEIWPKSFKKQRSYDNFKHLVKKRRILFLAPWTPNFRIFWIFENVSRSSRWWKSNGIDPIEIGLTVLEISRGAESPPPPPHQLTSSRKPTSNRVNGEIWVCAAQTNPTQPNPTPWRFWAYLCNEFPIHERSSLFDVTIK